jgi:DNA polymerase/3'-5' exonuclease PolX
MVIKEEECVWPAAAPVPVPVVGAEKPEPKKRGRKPKVKTDIVIDVPKKSPVPVVEKPEAKKRGRKPKSKTDVVEAPKKSPSPVVNVAKPEAKKRGRKPKSKLEVEEAKSDAPEQKKEPIVDDKPVTDHKAFILEALEKLRKKELANKQPFKARAYAKVLSQIKAHQGPIKSFEDVKAIDGIGKKIHDKLQEIFETGDLHQVHDYDANASMKIFEDLTQIHGVGPVKARELIDQHGIKTVDELAAKPELLNDVQRKGLKYYKDFVQRIPRAEMKKHEKYILGVIKKFGKGIQAAITVSFRREDPSSGDIDCLITGCDEAVFAKIMEKFKTDEYVVDVFAAGNKKVLATCKLLKVGTVFRRVDFMLTHENEYPFALLYFTGSQSFNIAMRNWSLARGLSLSEYGLKKTTGEGDFVDRERFKTEADVFAYLGLKYVEPKNRNTVKNLEDYAQ